MTSFASPGGGDSEASYRALRPLISTPSLLGIGRNMKGKMMATSPITVKRRVWWKVVIFN